MAEKAGTWIFTSATLSVNDQLDHFTQRMGLENSKSLLLASPFDYAAQALLCVPRFFLEPRERGAKTGADAVAGDYRQPRPLFLSVYLASDDARSGGGISRFVDLAGVGAG